MKTVYLAGNIAGRSVADATNWRNYAAQSLGEEGFTLLDPMRGHCYQNLSETLGFSNADQTPLEILNRDLGDVKKADIILANLTDLSVGTLFELGYAYALNKKTVIVLGEKIKHFNEHPFLSETSILFKDLESAISCIKRLS